MKLSDYTLSLLDDIENRIDPETEEDYRAQWQAFWDGNCTGSVFIPRRKKVSAPGVKPQGIHINDALHDYEMMLDAQLAGISGALASPHAALGMRANYGSAILASLFGPEIYEMPREMNTLPTIVSLNDSDRVRAILEKGLPDLNTGFGKDVLHFGEICAELFEKYPKIKKYVEVYHPDTQGPLDIAELLWGSSIFYEMYDDPDFVHGILQLVTDTYKAFLDAWYAIIPPYPSEICVHWGIMIKGKILLRLDSGVNLSGEFYEEFSKPYDKALLDYYGGGALHYCGHGDHFVPSLCEIDNLYGINLSQPELNNMDVILQSVCASDKRIFGLPRAAQFAEKPYMKKGILHG